MARRERSVTQAVSRSAPLEIHRISRAAIASPAAMAAMTAPPRKDSRVKRRSRSRLRPLTTRGRAATTARMPRGENNPAAIAAPDIHPRISTAPANRLVPANRTRAGRSGWVALGAGE